MFAVTLRKIRNTVVKTYRGDCLVARIKRVFGFCIKELTFFFAKALRTLLAIRNTWRARGKYIELVVRFSVMESSYVRSTLGR